MKISKPLDAAKLRREAYPSVGDQLDQIIKSLGKITEQGIDIGDAGRELIEASNKVKQTFKKS